MILSSAVAKALAFKSVTFAFLTAGPPVFNAALVLQSVVGISVLLDVWVTPIPFRLLYIIPAVILHVLFSFASGS